MKVKTVYKVSFCHRKPERSFFYKGTQFPVCARCTGFYVAYIFLPVFLFIHASWWLLLLLIIPAIIDGTTQAFFKRESNNHLRFITGLLAGMSFMGFTSIIGTYIGKFILYIVH